MDPYSRVRQATEMRCFPRLLCISYRDRVKNKEVRNSIRLAIGPYEHLSVTVRKHKLRWYGNITKSTGLAKMILQGTVEGGRRKSRHKKRWEDYGLGLGEALRNTERGAEWLEMVARSPLMRQRSFRLRDE